MDGFLPRSRGCDRVVGVGSGGEHLLNCPPQLADFGDVVAPISLGQPSWSWASSRFSYVVLGNLGASRILPVGNVDANDGVILGRLRATWSGPMGANAKNQGGEPSFRRPTEPARH